MKQLQAIALISLTLFQALALKADEIQAQKCDNALSLCVGYTQQLQDENELLKQEVTQLQDHVADDEDGLLSNIPKWTYVLLGVIVGGVGTKLLLK